MSLSLGLYYQSHAILNIYIKITSRGPKTLLGE